MFKFDAATEHSTKPQRSFLRLAVACGLGIFTLLIIASSRGRFHKLFNEFELSWSPLTILALSIFLPVAVMALVITTISIEFVANGPATKNTWNAVATGLALACLVAYLIGVSLPLMQLLHAVT